MSYEVLARKWRPTTFATMAGQEHVLRALINALSADRLHHAYLFTGTRGVGKTTVARILARCLNCETGVTPEPCGSCSSCREIDDGRFVDLIEVDAASRSKVEETRDLLENVQYAPTRGRYKVYLIDEVHMLSTASFNALLKTLEEPPPHVKFLLATTDPKKLPVTVLSRCLQFHLKNLTPERIVRHLEVVLEAEQVPAQSEALWALARAADGSMRDALSLTDQAIAFGNGELEADDVARMLGTIDQGALERILEGLAAGDGAALLACVADLAEHAADFAAVLRELMAVLHRIAVVQAVPAAAPAEAGSGDRAAALVVAMTGRLAPEDIQLYYQIALMGQRDLPFAPDPRSGFEMTLLRMLAFRPEQPGEGGAERGPGTGAAGREGPSSQVGRQATADAQADTAAAGRQPPAVASAAADGPALSMPSGAQAVASPPDSVEGLAQTVTEPTAALASATASAPASSPVAAQQRLATAGNAAAPPRLPPAAIEAVSAVAVRDAQVTEQQRFVAAAPALAEPIGEPVGEPVAEELAPDDSQADAKADPKADAVVLAKADRPRLDAPQHWHEVLPRLELTGLTAELVNHCLPAVIEDDRLQLSLDPAAESLHADIHVARIEAALHALLGRRLRVEIEVASSEQETPAQRAARERAERQRRAEEAIAADVNVQRLIEAFDAQVQRETIRPMG